MVQQYEMNEKSLESHLLQALKLGSPGDGGGPTGNSGRNSRQTLGRPWAEQLWFETLRLDFQSCTSLLASVPRKTSQVVLASLADPSGFWRSDRSYLAAYTVPQSSQSAKWLPSLLWSWACAISLSPMLASEASCTLQDM